MEKKLLFIIPSNIQKKTIFTAGWFGSLFFIEYNVFTVFVRTSLFAV